MTLTFRLSIKKIIVMKSMQKSLYNKLLT